MSVGPTPAAPASTGLMSALRAVGGTLNEMLRVRGALFAVELREEIERRRQMLVLAAVGFAFLHTALLLLTFFVAALFWDTHRMAALGGMTVLYLLCGGAALARLRRDVEDRPAPFAATLGELERDLDGMRTP